jgi:Holliday junction resolvase RusA-like endonuclease
MTNYLMITLPEKPKAKQRSRKGGDHWYNPQSEEMKKDKILVRNQLSDNFKIIGKGIPVVVNVTWFFIPTAAEQTKKFIALIKNEICPYTKKPDRDNLDKYILDVLSGIIFHDDNQVYDGRLLKLYTLNNPRMEVEIEW